MGMYPGMSICKVETCSTYRTRPEHEPRTRRKVSVPITPQPNPKKFTIVDTYYNGKSTAIKVNYLGCTNYEGMKVMVFKGHFDPTDVKELDPHFCENHVSPIARFEPTKEGWVFAMEFADLV